MTKNLRIFLVNDDGIAAPGLKHLKASAEELSDEVWIVAPDQERSSASRSLTLQSPLRVTEHGPREYSVSGTPTDCMLLALLEIMKDTPPDLVLSGINHGQNLAEDTHFSGTIAAAMQAMQYGFRAIAFSQTIKLSGSKTVHWQTARHYLPRIVTGLLSLNSWPAHVFYSVNFPDCAPDQVTGIEACRVGQRDQCLHHIDKRTDLSNRPYYWLGYFGKKSNPPEGVDLRAIYQNRISITPLQADLTDHDSLKALTKMIHTEQAG